MIELTEDQVAYPRYVFGDLIRSNSPYAFYLVQRELVNAALITVRMAASAKKFAVEFRIEILRGDY